MRALVMSEPAAGPERTVVAELPEPRPGPGQVRIEVSHAGVNFLDVMARRGDPGYVPSWPFLPGLEVAGRIRELGSGVTGLQAGQRVAAFTSGGGFAEVAVAEAGSTVAVPDVVPTEAAAAAPLLLTSAFLLITDVTRLRPDEALLMHSAAGGLGSAVAQLAGRYGAAVRVGTVGRPEKVPDALAAGWDVVLPRSEATAEAVRAAAGRAVDVVLDPLGTTEIELDLAVAAPGARIALFGNPAGGPPEPLPPLGRLIGGNVALAGVQHQPTGRNRAAARRGRVAPGARTGRRGRAQPGRHRRAWPRRRAGAPPAPRGEARCRQERRGGG
jgi:NADPH2:quinone reductase